ncbi:MAG TPA: YbhN family protein [Acidimicrobiales bacterium]|nr:YbhN family protein [Acidimicrobiales bacterium]
MDEGEDEAAAPVEPDAPRRRWPRLPHVGREVRATLTVVVLIFVFEYILLPEIARARKSVHLLGQVNVYGLVFAVLLEIGALVAYAELTHTVLSPGAPGRGRLFRINMSSLAVSHVLPGGTAAGTALSYRLFGEAGVPSSVSAFGLAIQGAGSALVLNALFWVALLVSIPMYGYNQRYGIAAVAGFLLIAAFTGVVLILTKGKQSAADRVHRIAGHLPFVNADRVAGLVASVGDRLDLVRSDHGLLRRGLVWAAANWCLDAASLWVFLLAFGHLVSPVDLLVAYGLANILAFIPVTPSGLGVVEGVLIATLVGFHVPRDTAVLGVLTWRLVNFWLPIPVGGAAYLSLRISERRLRELGEAQPAQEGPLVG